jgi:putative endonuclease
MYFVYIIECKDGTLYTGITNDVGRRLQEHKSGKGGSYTRAKKAGRLIYAEKCGNRGSALKREFEIKSWRREKKLLLIKKI